MRLFPAPDGVVDGDDLAGWTMAPFQSSFAAVSPLDMRTTLPPDYSGPLHVSWDLGGGPAEASFWRETRRREEESGVYLADRIAGMPAGKRAMVASIPATISPLEFLFANVLRGDGVLVRIQAGSVGPDALNPRSVARIRRLASPHAFLLIQTRSPAVGPVYDPASAAGDSAAILAAGRVSDPQPTVASASETTHGRPLPDRFT